MRRMLLLCCLCCALFSCSKENIDPFNASLGQEIQLKEGQAALYNNSGIEAEPIVKVKLERVRDSRCPTDATCVTYGSAIAEFRIGPGEGAGETVAMCLGECGAGLRSTDTIEVTVNATPYRIILLQITPHPTLKQKAGVAKEAKLIVERI